MIGSAHDDAGLELLLHVAHERLHAGQQVLGLGCCSFCNNLVSLDRETI